MRKLASIQRIANISDIFRKGEKADKIGLISFENIAWKCVGKKGRLC